MSTMNRRRFTLLGLSGVASATLVACGNDVGNEQAVNPTMISGVEGAPPTLVPGTPGAESEEPEGEGAAEVPAIEVQSLDTLKYEPAEITAPPGATIRMTNAGVLQHNFVVDELGGEVIPLTNGGEANEWTIPEDAAPGDYEFYCSVPGHREGGMVGTLTIDANAAGPAGEEDGTPAAEEGGEEAAEGGAAAGGSVHELVAEDPYAWSTNEITAAVGDTIVITNNGVLQHNFAIEEFGGDLTPLLNNGDTAEWVVEGEPGAYEYYCSVPGHREGGMVGTLTINPGSAPPAAEEEVPTEASEESAPTDGEAPADGGSTASGPIEVDMLDTLKFEPAEIAAAVGTVLTIKNAGVLQHNFVVDELGGDLTPMLNGGETHEWTVEGEPGTYEFYCSVPGHREGGMVGTLTIQ